MNAFDEPTFAWEPVTPRGVAAFARAAYGRLFVVQFIVALLAAGSVIWLLSDGFFPTIDKAINNLPPDSKIRSGKLDWPDQSPKVLAEGRFFEFNVDLDHGGKIRSPAQFQFEFGKRSLCIFSLFGESELEYPPYSYFPFGSNDLIPKWGAWKPDILAIAGISTFILLMVTWTLLATIYFLPAWLICFFCNRNLRLSEAWRLAGAALMPGALLMALSILLYDFGGLDLVQLCFAFAFHFVVGWIYLLVSPMFLKRVTSTEKKNPFTGEKQPSPPSQPPA